MSTDDVTPFRPAGPAPTTLTAGRRWASIVVVWVATLIGAVLIGFYSLPKQRLLWAGLTLAAAMVATMCIQLATQEKRGFVDRVTASIVGALVVLIVAGVIFILI